LSAGDNVSDPFHHESHTSLLHQRSGGVPPKTGAPRQLDAIIVPTIRPQSIGPAVQLAREVGCPLIVLCTTVSQAAEVARECQPMPDGSLVTYIPSPVTVDLPPFLTAKHPETGIERTCHADIARKRNASLKLARHCGWRTIMFLDDDIRGASASAAVRAAALTAHYDVAGFEIRYYPDNSVVCHAHRLAGGAQDVFLGGSAMVIDVLRNDTLFPPVYNEDWLFLFDAVQHKAVTRAGALSQIEFQPFARPSRASSEEFGEVIAEGLYWLLDEGGSLADATHEYWQAALQRRSQLIGHIAEQLLPRAETDHDAGRALRSLAAARGRLASITAEACRSFVRDWRDDVSQWQEHLAAVPVLADLPDAAKYLGLPKVDRRED